MYKIDMYTRVFVYLFKKTHTALELIEYTTRGLGFNLMTRFSRFGRLPQSHTNFSLQDASTYLLNNYFVSYYIIVKLE